MIVDHLSKNNLNKRVYEKMHVSYIVVKSLMIVIFVLSITPVVVLNVSSFALVVDSSQQSDWEKEKSMPVGRSEVAGATLNGKLYIIGGFDSSGRSTTGVEVYDPLTDEWGTSAPVPKLIDHAAVASYDGRLYLVGGGHLSEALSNKLFVYNPITNNWTEGANLPTARGALTANFINGTLYATGGIDFSGASNSNQAYDPKTDTWRERAPMPTAREHLTSAVADNKLYVIGGRQADDDGSPKVNVDRVEMYNPLNDSWAVMEQMPTKRSGIAAAASPINGNIYVFGGENPFRDEGPIRTLDVAERYNPKINNWTSEQAMPTARHGLAAMAIGGKIYVVSGGNEPGLSVSDVNEVFSVKANNTTT
jgi:N-acetylneuraminic acid mutarotase